MHNNRLLYSKPQQYSIVFKYNYNVKLYRAVLLVRTAAGGPVTARRHKKVQGRMIPDAINWGIVNSIGTFATFNAIHL